MDTLKKLQELNKQTGIFDKAFIDNPNPHMLAQIAPERKERPGYYGHAWFGELVFVAPLDCPDHETLEKAKRDAGVMSVAVYFSDDNA